MILAHSLSMITNKGLGGVDFLINKVAMVRRMGTQEFDMALAELQNALGQDDGGFASLFFPGLEDWWDNRSTFAR